MQGYLRKMQTRLDKPVQYELLLSKTTVSINTMIGKTIKLNYTGRIACVHCGRVTKKSFNQGYCYPCFSSLAQCDMCIMKPETCHFEKGTCREPDWGQSYCMQPHFVYLANSSGIKVGITRQNQIPTRWIDQGAVQALPIFKAQSRHISGLIEVAIAKHISDKTSWQQMLKNNVTTIDLISKRNELAETCKQELAAITGRFGVDAIEYLQNEQALEIHYPVSRYPDKVKSFNLDANPVVSGMLEGIKGQYLLLDSGVINLRKYSGYELELSVLDKADVL
ncbi:MAG: DUF2797 domain-containing protein [Methylococcaceae bacterium]|nr:DUF2797 domain-containing protein [Methylococcaceae bacterium]